MRRQEELSRHSLMRRLEKLHFHPGFTLAGPDLAGVRGITRHRQEHNSHSSLALGLGPYPLDLGQEGQPIATAPFFLLPAWCLHAFFTGEKNQSNSVLLPDNFKL